MKQHFNDDVVFEFEEALARHVSFPVLTLFVAEYHRWKCAFMVLHLACVVCKRQRNELAVISDPFLSADPDRRIASGSLESWFDANDHESNDPSREATDKRDYDGRWSSF